MTDRVASEDRDRFVHLARLGDEDAREALRRSEIRLGLRCRCYLPPTPWPLVSLPGRRYWACEVPGTREEIKPIDLRAKTWPPARRRPVNKVWQAYTADLVVVSAGNGSHVYQAHFNVLGGASPTIYVNWLLRHCGTRRVYAANAQNLAHVAAMAIGRPKGMCKRCRWITDLLERGDGRGERYAGSRCLSCMTVQTFSSQGGTP